MLLSYTPMWCSNPRIRIIRLKRCIAFDLILVTWGGLRFPSSVAVFDLQCHLYHAFTNSRRQTMVELIFPGHCSVLRPKVPSPQWLLVWVTGGRPRRLSAAGALITKCHWLAFDLRQWHFTLNIGPSDSWNCTFFRLLRRNSSELKPTPLSSSSGGRQYFGAPRRVYVWL